MTNSSDIPSDEYLRRYWRSQGGKFHGPNVETGTMPEAQLLPLLRKLLDMGDPAPEPNPQASPDEGFQARVHDWMAKCFQRQDAMKPPQRSFRFIEEALELAQAVGTSREDVMRLVEYVYGRPPGVVSQEIGGVMVTLSGLATSFGLSMEYAGNAELARCEENTERIRAKDLAKPQRSPLPGVALPDQALRGMAVYADEVPPIPAPEASIMKAFANSPRRIEPNPLPSPAPYTLPLLPRRDHAFADLEGKEADINLWNADSVEAYGDRCYNLGFAKGYFDRTPSTSAPSAAENAVSAPSHEGAVEATGGAVSTAIAILEGWLSGPPSESDEENLRLLQETLAHRNRAHTTAEDYDHFLFYSDLQPTPALKWAFFAGRGENVAAEDGTRLVNGLLYWECECEPPDDMRHPSVEWCPDCGKNRTLKSGEQA